jgi:hypothetical protein
VIPVTYLLYSLLKIVKTVACIGTDNINNIPIIRILLIPKIDIDWSTICTHFEDANAAKIATIANVGYNYVYLLQ